MILWNLNHQFQVFKFKIWPNSLTLKVLLKKPQVLTSNLWNGVWLPTSTLTFWVKHPVSSLGLVHLVARLDETFYPGVLRRSALLIMEMWVTQTLQDNVFSLSKTASIREKRLNARLRDWKRSTHLLKHRVISYEFPCPAIRSQLKKQKHRLLKTLKS